MSSQSYAQLIPTEDLMPQQSKKTRITSTWSRRTKERRKPLTKNKIREWSPSWCSDNSQEKKVNMGRTTFNMEWNVLNFKSTLTRTSMMMGLLNQSTIRNGIQTIGTTATTSTETAMTNQSTSSHSSKTTDMQSSKVLGDVRLSNWSSGE